jgi:flagellar basal-body rod protein FlgC
MNLFGVLGVSGSALTAERVRAEVTASNMANAETTRTPDGKLFQRQHVVFQSIGPSTSDDATVGTLGGSFANTFASQLIGRRMNSGFQQMNNGLTSGSPDEGGSRSRASSRTRARDCGATIRGIRMRTRTVT